MPHDYSIDLAFDLDSEPKGSYQGFLDLACIEDGGLHSLDTLKKDRNLYFTIYDTSEGTNQAKGTPTTLTVTFQNADTSTTTSSPLGSETTLTLSTFYDRGDKTSPAFGRGRSYYAQSNGQSGPDPSKFEITNTGRFFVTVALDVQYDNGNTPPESVTKTFGQDPRMNVDT